MAALQHHFGEVVGPIYCTKIASKLARTYTDRHGLKDLCRELLGKEISKHQQSSDWGAEELSQAQTEYAASDVLYLHDLMRHLNQMLLREDRHDLATQSMAFLKTRVAPRFGGMGTNRYFRPLLM